MTTYYANAFKTGSFPEITEDKIYLWSRPHPRDATASSDPIGKPQSFQLMEDAVFAVIMATSPSFVTLSTGPSSLQTFNVSSGVTKLSMPISAGGTMYGKIERGGNTIVELDPPFTFDPTPTTYNYNAVVAFASSNQKSTPPVEGTHSGNTPSSTVVLSSSVSGLPVSAPSPSPPSSSSASYPSLTSPTSSTSASSTSNFSSSTLTSYTPSPTPSSPSGGPASGSTPSPSPFPAQMDSELGAYKLKRIYRPFSN